MTKARDIADFKFENITDTGTEGTKVASGTSAQRGSTAGQWRYNTTIGFFEGRNADGTFSTLEPTPTIASVDDGEVDSAAGGNQTIVVTGTGFSSGGTIAFVGATAEFNATSTTINSSTQVTAVAPKASFLNAQEPYKVKFTTASGIVGISATGLINVDNSPIWQTASGSLGSQFEGESFSQTVSATDSDGDTVSYSVVSGALPGGVTLNSSSGLISGTLAGVSADTTYNFTLRASGSNLTSDRAFSVEVKNNTAPVWSTASGSLGTFYDSQTVGLSMTVSATDNEIAGQTLTYSVQSGTLPAGLSLNSTSGVISGNATSVGSDTTSTFTIRVSDGLLYADREFSITIKAPVVINSRSGSNHTFPSGITSISLLLVGGGGGGGNDRGNGNGGDGGGGGVYYSTNFSVTGGQNYSWSIGGGGAGRGCNNQSGCSGGSSSFAGITVGMGGGGVSEYNGNCNSGYSTGYTVDGGSGGCSFNSNGTNGGNAGTYTIGGTTITNAGVQGSNNSGHWGSGGINGMNAATSGATGGILFSY